MAINNRYLESLYHYDKTISKGFYGENEKKESEQFYLMAIKKVHIKAMFYYANKLSEALYVEERKKE
jgi:hypothetical protein